MKRVLCVDDEPNVLQAFERQFRKRFDIQTALGPQLGLEAIRSAGPFAVVVSDLRMPGMDGIEFLSQVRQMSPDTVRVMLTGQADLGAAIAAVNQGNIFQFLNKPCPSEVLGRALDAALEQHRLITSERDLLEKTLHGSIGMLSEILSLVNPPAFSRAERARRYVRHMAEHLGLGDAWQYELAAMVSQIGCITVPADVLDKVCAGTPLSPEEASIFASQGRVGCKLLAKIPRLEAVSEMVARQRSSWSTDPSVAEPVRIGSQLLKVALDFDEQMVRGGTFEAVLNQMRNQREYNPAYVSALEQVQVEESKRETRMLRLLQLKTGMIVNADVRSKTGLLLLAKGQEVTDSVLARLGTFAITVGVIEPINVIGLRIAAPEPSVAQAS
jgi:response regulator RpfG family c-di-GMP phosphodiesterase